MAYCPNCGAAMGMHDRACQACGYNFPPPESDERREGWAYSGAADVAIVISATLSLLAAALFVTAGVVAVFLGHFANGLYAIVVGVFMFAVFAAMTRVLTIKKSVE